MNDSTHEFTRPTQWLCFTTCVVTTMKSPHVSRLFWSFSLLDWGGDFPSLVGWEVAAPSNLFVGEGGPIPLLVWAVSPPFLLAVSGLSLPPLPFWLVVSLPPVGRGVSTLAPFLFGSSPFPLFGWAVLPLPSWLPPLLVGGTPPLPSSFFAPPPCWGSLSPGCLGRLASLVGGVGGWVGGAWWVVG